jgi:hypothetical protein
MTVENFNSFCRRDGREYEDVVIAHEILKNKSEVLSRNTLIPGTGVEMDVILIAPNQNLVKFVQAKGGKPGEGKRPGAKRTDNVKKAIADGALLKSLIPESVYSVYFSEEPNKGSQSDVMIEAALNAGIIDEVTFMGYAG